MSKKIERLLPFVALLLLLVVVLVVVVLDEVVVTMLLLLLFILNLLLSTTSKGVEMVVAYEDFSSWQQFELEVTSEFCSVSGKKSGSQSSKIRALIGLEISSCSEW